MAKEKQSQEIITSSSEPVDPEVLLDEVAEDFANLFLRQTKTTKNN